MSIDKPIIIAGAGPAGTTAALYLAKKGLPIILLEAEEVMPKTIRASTWHPPTLDMMDELGIVQPLIDQGLICPTYQYRDRRTGRYATFDLGLLSDITKHPYRLQTEQWKMSQLAWQILDRDYPNVECLLGHSFMGAHQTVDSVEVLAWTSEGEKKFEGSYLIGADGSNSRVRQSQAIKFEGFTWPERFLVLSTHYPIHNQFENLSWVNYVSDPEEWIVFLKAPDFWRILIPTQQELSDDTVLSDEWIQERMHRMIPDVTGDIDIAHRSLYRVHQRVAETYHRGRILLAGDSCHMNNPLGGMGMNGGIHDAWNLAEKLVAIHEGGDPDVLLPLYDRQRRETCKRFVQENTIKNKKALEEKDPEAQAKQQAKYEEIAADPVRAKEFLKSTSMIDMLEAAAAIQ